MKAIVCDKCGKVILLEDDKPYWVAPAGVFVLQKDAHPHVKMDLCEDCVDELMEAVRRTKDGDGNE